MPRFYAMLTGMRLACVITVALAIGCACGGSKKQAVAKPEPPKPIVKPALTQTLRVIVTPTSAPDAETPRHQVVVEVTGGAGGTERVDIGEWAGACSEESGGEAVLQVRCWWAGAGDVLTIIRDDDTLILAHVVLDEQTPPGPPEMLGTIKLEPGAKLDVVRAAKP